MATKTPRSAQLGPIRALASVLLSRMGLMSQGGFGFGGDRDYYATFGYKRETTPYDLWFKYIRQDIARTIVNAPADALWTSPPAIEGSTQFKTAWEALARRWPIWSVLNRADRMTGWGRFSLIVVGLKGNSALKEPVDMRRAKSVDDIIYLQPYSEMSVSVETWNRDKASPRYGYPETYKISVKDGDFDGTNMRPTGNENAGRALRDSFEVHWTRCIHIADNLLEDSVYGIPRLFAVYNLLDDLLKVAGGSAESYWLTANRGMQLDIDKDLEMDEEDAKNLSDEADEYVHGLRRIIRTRGTKVTALGNRVADPHNSFTTLLALIAGATRIPQRILVGSEAGQLASEQDRANWAERVVERRANFGVPYALAPTIDTFTRLGVLPKDEKLIFNWPEAFILAPLERAQTSAQKARSATNLAKTLTEKPDLMTTDEARQIIGFGDTKPILSGTKDNPTDTPALTVVK